MKIRIFDRHMGVTIARGVDQNLADIMRYNATIYRISNKEPTPVKAATSLCSNVLFTNHFPYFVQIILAGYDAQWDGQIYNIGLFGSMTNEKFITLQVPRMVILKQNSRQI